MSIESKVLRNEIPEFKKQSQILHKGHFTNVNQYSFKNIIKYLTSLKEHDLISEDDFVTLVNYACGIFIENEVEKRISKIFKEKFSNQLNKFYFEFK